MRCKHCGSSCKNALDDELTTEEALSLCNDLSEAGLKLVTLSGGEPLLRSDWPLIAKAFSDQNVMVTMISNGWLINEEIIEKAKNSGLLSIAISLDGIQETHDTIRMSGSFERSIKALHLMKEKDLSSSVITTVMKSNLFELPFLYDQLKKANVKFWQFQIGCPMGNLSEHSNELLESSDMSSLMDFIWNVYEDGIIFPVLSDCIGYYTKRSTQLRRSYFKGDISWNGCPAGRYNVGIFCNGDIGGCTSIRDKKYIEGNIRNDSFSNIWNNENAFQWNRNPSINDLSGFCKNCSYVSKCFGGCFNIRKTFNKTDYPFCLYKSNTLKLIEKVKYTPVEKLEDLCIYACENGLYDVSLECADRLLENNKNNIKSLEIKAFIFYVRKEYDISLEYNDRILKIESENFYALKGKALCFAAHKEYDLAKEYLEKSIVYSPKDYTDVYYDLALVFYENKEYLKCIDTIKKVRNYSTEFKNKSDHLYKKASLKIKSN
jgi:radical SAM protein with 4Fe4S-binding SPASM domain